MKKILKITYIAILLLLIYSMFYNIEADSIWETGEKFLQTGAGAVGMLDEQTRILDALGIDTKDGFEELIDFLWGLGLLVVFITTIVLGIKYMLVLPGEKSRLKQSTTPYIVGVVIIFGALTIWKFVIIVLDGNL